MEQKRKSLLVILVLVLGLSGSAFAGDVFWDGSASNDWTDGENWVGGVVPGLSDYGLIGDPTLTQPVIASGQNISAQRVVVGQVNQGCTMDVLTGGSITSDSVNFAVGRSGGGGTLNISGGDVISNTGFCLGNYAKASNGVVNMTAGTLTVHDNTTTGNWWLEVLVIGDGGYGEFNMDGGAVTVDNDMYITYPRELSGVSGDSGHLNMTGGTMDIGGNILLTQVVGSGNINLPGDIQLDGGTITASDLIMTSVGSMNVTGDGMMILAGDDTLAVQGYIDSGWITGAACTYDLGLDETTIAVPEPATMVLLGLGGLLSLRRRRTN